MGRHLAVEVEGLGTLQHAEEVEGAASLPNPWTRTKVEMRVGTMKEARKEAVAVIGAFAEAADWIRTKKEEATAAEEETRMKMIAGSKVSEDELKGQRQAQ